MVVQPTALVEVVTATPGTIRKSNAESVSVINKDADMITVLHHFDQTLSTSP